MVAQGTTLAGRYRLDTRIGAGGMGEVWRGEDIVLARTVAVKVLLPGRTDDPGFLVRFQGEARAMATINHPGVVDVYDYGVHEVPGAGATAYLVMKFVDGEPLDRLLARLGSIAPGAAMELIAQAASALQAVHDQGIVHRDIKPGNLLVRSDGTLVLTDFGIARSDAASRLTDAGMVLGTAAYCAPEQAEGAPVTPAVDIYALGVVAYECLAGQRPFDGDTPVTIALKHIREAPPPLPPHIPPAVRALVERALSKDPARRFPSAAAMSTAARQAALGVETGGAASPHFPQTPAAPGTQGEGTTEGGWPGAAPPQTGWQAAPVPQAGASPAPATPGPTTEIAPAGRGRRASRKPRRKGGMLVVSAAAGVMCVGLVAVAINGMAASGGVTIDPAAQPGSAATISEPADPPKTSNPHKTTTRPPRTSTPPVRPTPTQEDTPTPSDTPTPTSTPTKSPTAEPTDDPTGKPSPTPTHTPTKTAVPKKKVPNVRDLSAEAAEAMLQKAGFKVTLSDETDVDPSGCIKVISQRPAGGTMWDPRQPVELTVVNDRCPPTPTATPTPTSSARAAS
ncbi:protein kinase [Streptosporangium sp. NPDC051022]|uniref:serine/threonine protein kinase n=1 Tax=Streptosporangium sp. NPDC051022 TaxID=3155752 RepID=UPI00341486C2